MFFFCCCLTYRCGCFWGYSVLYSLVMTQFAIWFSVPSGYVYLWDESAMTCLQFVFSVPCSGYVHSDDESAMKCFEIGCSVPGRYGYMGASQL